MVRLPDALRRDKTVRRALPLLLPPDEWFDALCETYRAATGADGCCITLVDRSRFWIRADAGLDGLYDPYAAMPLERSFCVHILTSSSAVVVSDTTEHPKLQACVLADEWCGWAGHAFAFDGVRVGAIQVLTHDPNTWPVNTSTLLAQAAALIESEIVGRNTDGR